LTPVTFVTRAVSVTASVGLILWVCTVLRDKKYRRGGLAPPFF
jgi:hypothetical protein